MHFRPCPPVICVFRFIYCFIGVYVGLNVDVANFLGLKEINLALNVVILVALIMVLVTIIETRIQIIGRLGECSAINCVKA